jgi:hypothetical protein
VERKPYFFAIASNHPLDGAVWLSPNTKADAPFDGSLPPVAWDMAFMPKILAIIGGIQNINFID